MEPRELCGSAPPLSRRFCPGVPSKCVGHRSIEGEARHASRLSAGKKHFTITNGFNGFEHISGG